MASEIWLGLPSKARVPRLEYAEQFLIKGALLFDLWFAMTRRPTRDADSHVLLGDSGADEVMLGNAVRRTFERRRTPLPERVPVGLSDDFVTASGKNTQWQAFISKNMLEVIHPGVEVKPGFS
jgi:hypothetical protein